MPFREGATSNVDRWTLNDLALIGLSCDDGVGQIGDLLVGLAPLALNTTAPAAPLRRIVVMDLDAATTAWLGAAAPGAQLLRAATEAEALPLLPEADALFGWTTPGMLAAAPRLRWIQTYTAGVEMLSGRADMHDGALAVTSMRGVAAPVVAEHAIALLFALARRLDTPVAPAAKQRKTRSLTTIEGRRSLVVGLGSVGSRIAMLSRANGMHVSGIRARGLASPPAVDEMIESAALPDRIGEFDVVFNALPLTDRTRRIFDAPMFARMQSGACFVNVGRGGTVDTTALLKELLAGRLSAGLDVVDPEPLPANHPIRRAPNMLITPHEAGSSATTRRRELLLLRENLRRFITGAPLLAQVDMRVGY